MSQASEAASPSATASMPAAAASSAICSGLRASWRAAAAGMISSDTISRMPTIFMPTATASAISSMKTACTRPTATPSACASSWCTVALSSGDHSSSSASSTAAPPHEDPEQIAAVDRQHVAEQIGRQVDPHGLERAERDQAERQGDVGEDAEQRVGRELALALQQHERAGEGEADADRRGGQIDAEQHADRDAEQRAVGERVAEVRHPPPHHEAAERPGERGDAEAAEQRAHHEVIEHRAPAGRRRRPPRRRGRGRDRAHGCRPRAGPRRARRTG